MQNLQRTFWGELESVFISTTCLQLWKVFSAPDDIIIETLENYSFCFEKVRTMFNCYYPHGSIRCLLWWLRQKHRSSQIVMMQNRYWTLLDTTGHHWTPLDTTGHHRTHLDTTNWSRSMWDTVLTKDGQTELMNLTGVVPDTSRTSCGSSRRWFFKLPDGRTLLREQRRCNSSNCIHHSRKACPTPVFEWSETGGCISSQRSRQKIRQRRRRVSILDCHECLLTLTLTLTLPSRKNRQAQGGELARPGQTLAIKNEDGVVEDTLYYVDRY